MKVFGFITKDPRQTELERDVARDRNFKRQNLRKKIFEKEETKALKKKYSEEYKQKNIKQPSFIKGLVSSVKKIGDYSNRQMPRPQVQRYYEREMPRPRRRNFFEHREEMEVYGDEDLTFFDSNKRGGGSTANLFGFD